ncbi:MAG: hypothetical protein ACRD8W_03400 [Nitrososphaeraceae archaeon]
MTSVAEQETEEYKEQKKKEFLETITAWKPSIAEKELFNDRDYWELSAQQALEEQNKKIGWNNGNGGGNGNGKGGGHNSSSGEQQPKRESGKIEYIQKHSDGNILAEAVVIGNKPYFAFVDFTATIDVPNFVMPNIELHEGIRLDEKTILKPESTNNRPYVFKSEKEFTECIQKARNETLDSLYKKVLALWRKYIDANDFHLKICTADTIFSYKQDIIGMTHYLFFVADNDAGKSNNLTMFNLLAYRNMMSNSMTYANIYNFLGSRDEGVGTLCEDEADNIDEDHDKMGVYKEGYTKGHPVLRIIDTPYGKKQVKFNTFGFKAFAGERLPDAVYGRGFLQRTIVLKCLPGFPEYDISEVTNPAGDDEFQELIDELDDLRNLLFCYFRILHYKDKLPNIKLNIRNREKQLFKPILRVFQNTDTFNDLLPVISKYIGDRREGKVNSFHAFLYRLVRDLIKSQGTYELESVNIWNFLKLNVDYKDIPFKPQSIETVEFGILSQKGVIQTLKEVFQAEPPKYHSNSRRLIFSTEIIDRMAEVYDIDVEVNVQEDDTLRTHRTLRTHVGLDKHIEDNVSNDGEKPTDCNEASQHPRNVSYVSYASYPQPQDTAQQLTDKPRTYFLNGKWHCESCNEKGDKFYMEDHKCNGNGKEVKK